MHRKSDNCIKFQLVPQRHDSSLESVLFSLLSSFLPHLQSTVMKHVTRRLVNLATLMDVVLLLLAEALDEHIRLDKETAAMEKEKESSMSAAAVALDVVEDYFLPAVQFSLWHLALKQQRSTQ